MSRGKSFNHKRKNHSGEFPKDILREEKDPDTMKQVADFATYEAFKNRVNEEED